MSTTWVLVADSAKARLFALDDERHDISEVQDFLNPDGRAAGREILQDREPRVHDRFGEARHAIEPRTTERDKATTRFARELDAVLEHGRDSRRYDALVLIAPPQFLGTLRDALGERPRACIAAEVAMNLTAADAQTIRAHLPPHLQGRRLH